jgi:hypothetical protein
MESPLSRSGSGEPGKARAELVATTINSMLSRLANAPGSSSIALVGYRTRDDDTADVGLRWDASLGEETFVDTDKLADSPIRIEQRTRRASSSGEQGESIDFPIWYEPELAGEAPQTAAFEFVAALVNEISENDETLVVHITSSSSSDGDPSELINTFKSDGEANSPCLVVQARLAADDATVPAIVFPSNPAFLPNDEVKGLFRQSSRLPAHLINALLDRKLQVLERACGIVFNAGLVEVSHVLGLIPTFLGHLEEEPIFPEPPPEDPDPEPTPDDDPEPETETGDEATSDLTTANAPSISPDQPALVLFLVDRSISANNVLYENNVYRRLQLELGNQLEKIIKLQSNAVEIGIITYGVNGDGNDEVQTLPESLDADGSNEGIRDIHILDHALRVEESEEQIADGIGGAFPVWHERPFLFDHGPTSSSSLNGALSNAMRIISDWQTAHSQSSLSPVILNLTRGEFDADDLQACEASVATGTYFYNVIFTESDHVTLSCPSTSEEIQEPILAQLWGQTSPLQDGEHIAAKRSSVQPGARGFVINGTFPHLLYSIRLALSGE